MWRTEPKSISNSLLMAGQCCHSNMKTVTRACFSSTGGLKATQTCILFGFHFLILQFTTGLYRICQKDIHYRISKPHSNIFKWPRAKRETTKTAFSVKLETLFKKKKIPGTRQLINLQNSKPITEEPHHRNTTNGVQRRTTVLHNVQSISNLLPDLATVQSMLELQKPSMHLLPIWFGLSEDLSFCFQSKYIQMNLLTFNTPTVNRNILHSECKYSAIITYETKNAPSIIFIPRKCNVWVGLPLSLKQ